MVVNRAGHPNDTLLFWGFEQEALANLAQWRPWFFESPRALPRVHNNYNWDRLTDAMWVD
ncbi:hypothetical protein JAAARDRAFT_198873 [Jaapia argillacea MUCL 33604]|uniref:Uncharacterized protein n=1 Tax=Jaapia argillacea MUCL 33604 TaxID=933084 RepID=A0A067PA60_9AGAM|nr:hypothetical protein JAAARDRAFT_198873 [Jaapia argillacea MUCL 33604]